MTLFAKTPIASQPITLANEARRIAVRCEELWSKAPGWVEVTAAGTVITYDGGQRIPGRLEVAFDDVPAVVARAAVRKGTSETAYRHHGSDGVVTLAPGDSFKPGSRFKRVFIRLKPGDGPIHPGGNSSGPWSWMRPYESSTPTVIRDEAFTVAALDKDVTLDLVVGDHAALGSAEVHNRASRAFVVPALSPGATSSSYIHHQGSLTSGGAALDIVHLGRILTAYELRQYRRVRLVMSNVLASATTEARTSDQRVPYLEMTAPFAGPSTSEHRRIYYLGATVVGARGFMDLDLGPPAAFSNVLFAKKYNEATRHTLATLNPGAGVDCQWTAEVFFVLDDGDPMPLEVLGAQVSAPTFTFQPNEIASIWLPRGMRNRRAAVTLGYSSYAGPIFREYRGDSVNNLTGGQIGANYNLNTTAISQTVELSGAPGQSIGGAINNAASAGTVTHGLCAHIGA